MGPSFHTATHSFEEEQLSASASSAPSGIVDSDAKDRFSSEASAAGLLLVELGVPRPAARGRLAFFIDGAVERALDARGAPAPRVSITANFDASLADQVDRAQTSGASGIALWFGRLDEVAKTGILDCEDSSAIRRLIRASEMLELRVGFDARNHALSVYADPEPFTSILSTPRSAPEVAPSPTPPPAPESVSAPDVASALGVPDVARAAADAPDAPSPELPVTDSESEADALVESAPESARRDDELLAESARAMADELSGDENAGWLREALMELSTPKPRPAIEELLETRAAAAAALDPGGDEPEVHPEIQDFDDGPDPVDETPTSFTNPQPFHIAFAEATVEPPKPTVDPELKKRLEGFARELEFANGPKPLAVVERLFASAYVPLRAALDRGTDLPNLLETADEWARSFEKSYSEAFDALRMRTKRPKMIPDLPDLALRIGRLHGARTVQLLLVDGMRFDLGDTVHDKLRTLSGQRAACADRLIVWSALPTRTAAQVELLGRGVPGLREFTGEVSEDMVVARGRKASMIRRLKTGHREVLKLDVVEARLAEPGGVTPARLDGIADEVAQRIAAYFEDLQPRTLVMVFGDHGFRLTSGAEGIVTARQGGASPDEVLVPAFAWLVGAVH